MYVYTYIHINKNLLLTFFYVLHKSTTQRKHERVCFQFELYFSFPSNCFLGCRPWLVYSHPHSCCVFLFPVGGARNSNGIIQITWKNNHIYFPCKCLVLIDMSLYDGLTLQLTIEKSIKSHCFGGLISSFIFSSSPNEYYF